MPARHPDVPGPGLYAIVDPDHTGGRDPLRVASAIVEGGCAVLQLRAKRMGDGALLDLACRMAGVCAEAGVPFVVNDRADVALLAGAQGVHLGQEDLPVPAVRRLVGAQTLLGLSTHDLAQARVAADLPIHLIGFGPIFGTRTKARADPVVGLDALQTLTTATALPVVAIGGVTSDTAPAVSRAGARWVAAVSAVCAAEDPHAAARALHLASGGDEPERLRPT